MIYKTRVDSIFTKIKNKEFAESFDPFTKTHILNFTDYKYLTKDEVIKTLPLKIKLFNKNNILKIIENAHESLNLRDKLYIKTNELILKLRKILKDLSNEFIADRKFSNFEDLRYFEIDELNNIKKDNFYGNIPFTKFFKASQEGRFNYQIMPSELFEKDIDTIYEITNKQIEKLTNLNEINCLSFFHKQDIELNDFFVERVVRLTDLPNIIDKKAIITENTSIFSFTTEFAAINEIPIYTGLKYAPLILKNKKIIPMKNKLKLK
jgi:hypothetical protein